MIREIINKNKFALFKISYKRNLILSRDLNPQDKWKISQKKKKL